MRLTDGEGDRQQVDVAALRRRIVEAKAEAEVEEARRRKTAGQWWTDPVLGDWMTTTSRAMLFAPTGAGKTMFGMAVGMRIAAGQGFLHREGRSARRVLFIDREMSHRLLKARLADDAVRMRPIRCRSLR
jgi:RecA-family ATPase